MRRLPPRPALSNTMQNRLVAETQAISDLPNLEEQKAKAEARYHNARGTQWFSEVVTTLQTLSGTGQRCMYCSGSEASEVEHYRPKAVFPELVFTWENLLWVCGVCNRHKGNRFPPETETGQALINPLDEDVWQFFFIDEYGNLTAQWSESDDDYHPRAVKTMEVIQLDREVLQSTRQQRLLNLSKAIRYEIAAFHRGEITVVDLQNSLDAWLHEPYQSDVANYFLLGPGKSEPPFCELFAILNP